MDAIGSLKPADCTLVDCMVALLPVGRAVKMIKDPLWLALFLHPHCVDVAVSSLPGSKPVTDANRIALRMGESFRWSPQTAFTLAQNIQSYYEGKKPFERHGTYRDGASYWENLPVDINACPLKALACMLFHIVPHSADVERFLSTLSRLHTRDRNSLTDILLQPANPSEFIKKRRVNAKINVLAVSQLEEITGNIDQVFDCAADSVSYHDASDLVDIMGQQSLLFGSSVEEDILGKDHLMSVYELDAAWEEIEERDRGNASENEHLDQEALLAFMFNLSMLDSLEEALESRPVADARSLMSGKTYETSDNLRSLGM
ncbi:hypothetical protein RUND412_010353 [Rhizina undulata]